MTTNGSFLVAHLRVRPDQSLGHVEAFSPRISPCSPASAKQLRISNPGKSKPYPLPSKVHSFLEDDLRHAWHTKAFDLVYQPQVDLTTHEVASFEALLRWQHPVHGPISPADFIPVAEKMGLIGDIGQWVLDRACHTAATWSAQIGLAVNVSALQLQDPNFPDIVANILEKSGLLALRLELEITETAIISNDPTSLQVLHTIRKSGVRIAMDDFDAGYSGLGYLLRFPYDKIKLDQSFIKGLSHTEDRHATARSIVRAVISLCCDLNVAFVAEGVETAEQLSILMTENCTHVQGYFVGFPLPAPFVMDTVSNMHKCLQGLQMAKKPDLQMSLQNKTDDISFSQIAEMSHDPIMITTAQMAPPGPLIVYVNPAFTRMTGYSLADIVGQSPHLLQGTATSHTTLNRIRVNLEIGRSVHERLVSYTHSGVPYWSDLDIVSLRDSHGKVTHFAATQRDMTLASLQDGSSSHLNKDPLSGLDNEDTFSRQLQNLIARNEGNMTEITSVTAYLILIDIDDFKVIQKKTKLGVSDCVVRGVADCLAKNIRRADSLSRLDDGTFAICLPSNTLQDAKHAAERLRNAVAQARLVTPLGLMSVTISLGMNGLRFGDSISTLTLRTATALSAAQLGGQNRMRMTAARQRQSLPKVTLAASA